MIGQVIGHYKIVSQIGEGGMGAVYCALDLMLEREVAIKALKAELARQPQVVERFRAEAITLAKLNHPNIATLYSFFRQGEDYYMVMEYVRGEPLDAVLRREGALSRERAVRLFCEALEGVGRAHRLGIIHRDLKLSNLMLTDEDSIKVMDFGIARVLGTARMTRQGHLIGTIEYMSPEQIRGGEADARSDIYSLGILLYELLAGRVPFASDSDYDLMRMQVEVPPPSPRAFVPSVPEWIERAIMRALAKSPAERFQSVAEFRAALLAAPAPAAPRVFVPPYEPRPTRYVAPLPEEDARDASADARDASAAHARPHESARAPEIEVLAENVAAESAAVAESAARVEASEVESSQVESSEIKSFEIETHAAPVASATPDEAAPPAEEIDHVLAETTDEPRADALLPEEEPRAVEATAAEPFGEDATADEDATLEEIVTAERARDEATTLLEAPVEEESDGEGAPSVMTAATTAAVTAAVESAAAEGFKGADDPLAKDSLAKDSPSNASLSDAPPSNEPASAEEVTHGVRAAPLADAFAAPPPPVESSPITSPRAAQARATAPVAPSRASADLIKETRLAETPRAAFDDPAPKSRDEATPTPAGAPGVIGAPGGGGAAGVVVAADKKSLAASDDLFAAVAGAQPSIFGGLGWKTYAGGGVAAGLLLAALLFVFYGAGGGAATQTPGAAGAQPAAQGAAQTQTAPASVEQPPPHGQSLVDAPATQGAQPQPSPTAAITPPATQIVSGGDQAQDRKPIRNPRRPGDNPRRGKPNSSTRITEAEQRQIDKALGKIGKKP